MLDRQLLPVVLLMSHLYFGIGTNFVGHTLTSLKMIGSFAKVKVLSSYMSCKKIVEYYKDVFLIKIICNFTDLEKL